MKTNTNERIQELANNPEIFHFQTSEEDGRKDIFIDLTSVMSFYIDPSYGEKTLVTKMITESKSTYLFADDADYDRFFQKWNEYVAHRATTKYLANTMLGEIVGVLREDLEKNVKEHISNAVEEMQKAFSNEINTFKESVKSEADVIVNTALGHQVKINKQNDIILESLGKMVERANEVSNKFEAFTSKIDNFENAINSIAPKADMDIKKDELDINNLNKEVENV